MSTFVVLRVYFRNGRWYALYFLSTRGETTTQRSRFGATEPSTEELNTVGAELLAGYDAMVEAGQNPLNQAVHLVVEPLADEVREIFRFVVRQIRLDNEITGAEMQAALLAEFTDTVFDLTALFLRLFDYYDVAGYAQFRALVLEHLGSYDEDTARVGRRGAPNG